MKKRQIILLTTPLILFFSSFLIDTAHTAIGYKKKQKYKTSFGQCPSRTVGSLALRLIKVFEKEGSLRSMKKEIIDHDLDEKHFISEYKIDYNPLEGSVHFKFECPEPLMKVQIYKENGSDSYEAILAENGELLDPTYEVLLRAENRLTGELPFLAIPVGEMDKDFQLKITEMVKNLKPQFRKRLSEVILDTNNELTIILSIKGNPSSVFLGDQFWDNKLEKLIKIVDYMESKERIPAVINLTNLEKIVVKFSDKF
jgi:hypothetical protein